MTFSLENKRILITGGRGFLGNHLTNVLIESGVKPEAIFTFSSKEYNLLNKDETRAVVEKTKPDLVINLAAKRAGIGDNMQYPASHFYENLMIGVNIVEACAFFGVAKLINIGTACSYPKSLEAPFKEKDLWEGYPAEANAPYGVAKKAVMVFAETARRQYGLNSVNIIMTNLYGPGDDFREQTSHVIPSIIKKMHLAKERKEDKIVAWGDGSPSRDFLYGKDAALGIVQAAQQHNDPMPVNLGSGKEVTIRQLMEYLKDLTGFEGAIEWDHTKPNGQPRRLLDITTAKESFGFNPATSFQEGLKETYHWFLQNIDK